MAREDWARALTATVSDVFAQLENLSLWLLLYILPRCMLGARPKERGVSAQSAAKVVWAACRRWRSGEAAKLWKGSCTEERGGGGEGERQEQGGSRGRRRSGRTRRRGKRPGTWNGARCCWMRGSCPSGLRGEHLTVVLPSPFVQFGPIWLRKKSFTKVLFLSWFNTKTKTCSETYFRNFQINLKFFF